MKHRVFFLEDKNLIEYLEKFGHGLQSKDYEFSVALHAKSFWQDKLGQKLIICFEQNDKMHKYPARFTATVEEIKDILLTYNKEDTPVDFLLAPINQNGEPQTTGYPFQIKKFIPKSKENLASEFAAFINKKANSYRDKDLCIIFLPEMLDIQENTVGMSIDEVKQKLIIQEEAVRLIYCFQFSNGKPTFVPIWISQQALREMS